MTFSVLCSLNKSRVSCPLLQQSLPSVAPTVGLLRQSESTSGKEPESNNIFSSECPRSQIFRSYHGHQNSSLVQPTDSRREFGWPGSQACSASLPPSLEAACLAEEGASFPREEAHLESGLEEQ